MFKLIQKIINTTAIFAFLAALAGVLIGLLVLFYNQNIQVPAIYDVAGKIFMVSLFTGFGSLLVAGITMKKEN